MNLICQSITGAAIAPQKGQATVPRGNSLHLLVCMMLIAICACDRQAAELPVELEVDRVSGNPNMAADPDGSEAAKEATPDAGNDAGEDVAAKYEDVPDGKLIVHKAAAGDLQDDGWCVATSTRGNFQVELPGKYVDQMVKGLGTNGAPGGVMHTVAAATEQGVEFNALQTEAFGPLPDTDMFQNMADKFTNMGVDVKKVDIVINGHPARKLVGTHPTIAAEMAFLTVGLNHYMISVQFKPQLHEQLRDDIDRFHNSFAIVGSDQ